MIFAQLFLGWGNQPRPEQLFCSRACCCSPGMSQGFPAKPCFFRNFPHFDPGPVVSWDGPSVGSPGPLPGPGGCSGADTQKHLQVETGQASQLPPNPHCSQPGVSSCVIHHTTQGWGKVPPELPMCSSLRCDGSVGQRWRGRTQQAPGEAACEAGLFIPA